jgi:hypothetical protein
MPPARKKGKGVISSAVKTAVPLWMGLGPAAVAAPPVAAAVGAARVARRVGKKLIGRGAWDKVKTGLKWTGLATAALAAPILLGERKREYRLGPNGFYTHDYYGSSPEAYEGWKELGKLANRPKTSSLNPMYDRYIGGKGLWDKVKKVGKVVLPAAAVAGMTYLGAKDGKQAWDNRKKVHAVRKKNFDNGNISILGVPLEYHQPEATKSIFDTHREQEAFGQRRQRGGALPAFLLPAVSYLAPAATAYAKGLLVSAIMHALHTAMNLVNYEPGEWMAYLKYQLRQLFTTRFLIDGPLQQFIGQKVQQMVYGLPPNVKELAAQAVKEELAVAAAATKARRAARFSKLEPGQVPGLNGPVPFVSASAHA